jgi:3-hydroxybutyryl-CoA dehydrogenase
LIKTIVILGAGTMGQGIAQVASLAGYEVMIYDLSDDILSRSLEIVAKNIKKGIARGKITEEEGKKAISSIRSSTDLASLKGDLFIEAAVENLEIKKKLFNTIQENNPEAILATNTSTIPITQNAAGLPTPEHVVGMHFFNPAFIMKLVEVVKGVETSASAASLVKEVAEKMGKTPVLVQDSPGFIVNRVARHYYVESLKILEERISDPNGIDRLLESSGFRMGPFKLMDLIGVDTNFLVTQNLYNQFHQDPKFRPSRIQQQLVEAGHIGKKSGRGFYEYDQK